MPRPKREEAPSPKRRSRNGCWPCKARKVKCGEEKPKCLNCERQGETCDYSIRLNWGGRSKKKDGGDSDTSSRTNSPHSAFFSFQANTFSESLQSPRPASNTHQRASSNISNSPSEPPVDSAQALAGYNRPYSPYNADYGGTPLTGKLGLPYSSPEPTIHVGSIAVEPRLQSLQAQHTPDYSTPSVASSRGSPAFGTRGRPESPATGMLPTFRSYSSYETTDYKQEEGLEEHRSKRIRLSPNREPTLVGLVSNPNYPQMYDDRSTGFISGTYLSPNAPSSMGAPTPASGLSVETSASQMLKPVQLQAPPDLRRLSVNSLLSGPLSEASSSQSNFKKPMHRSQRSYSDLSTIYGYDLGMPDLDLPNNDDTNAIKIMSPNTARGVSAFPAERFEQVETDELDSRSRDVTFEKGGYYAKPVSIRIPKIL
ncbi:hypothetical protein LTS18_007526, partial [Coniosporium uncinatum]